MTSFLVTELHKYKKRHIWNATVTFIAPSKRQSYERLDWHVSFASSSVEKIILRT